MINTWTEIKDFPNYEINKLGQVRSKKTLNVLKGGLDRNGYKCVNIRKEGKTYYKPIHRLVAYTFLNEIQGKNCVNHKDLNKLNNCIDNLEFCNYYENNTHMKKNGKATTSKYAGVSYEKCRGKYKSYIKYQHKNYFLGRFETELEAYNAYLNAMKKFNIENKYA
jgi:hypothetical protein